jgi:hypothetical protein
VRLCVRAAHASTEAADVFYPQHMGFQLSSYSTVLLAVAKTQALIPMRHQPQDKQP